jgi:hypothetical protein
MGFFVGMTLGVRALFKLPIKQKHFRSAATDGSGEQLDQPANGGVWVQNPLHSLSGIQSPDSLTSHRVIRQKKFFPYHLCILDIYKSPGL